MIEIKELSKDYEKGFLKKTKIKALDGLTLDVEAGQIFGFLGGNGAGKTTTIKILMGLIFPTGGTAKILGSEIADLKMRSRIGYCPENPYFYDYLTVNELLDYFGRLFGLPTAERQKRTNELLTKVGLKDKDRNRQLRKFSKGMQQRVGLAQALINEPEIVFLDEPMSGLDPVGRREIRELILELREKGTTVFMSTHILSDVEALCDNVAILREGKLAATGKLRDLLNEDGENRAFEILAGGVSAESLLAEMSALSEVLTSSKPSGTSIIVKKESDIDAALAAVRKFDGSIISVNPVKQSLEDFFARSEE